MKTWTLALVGAAAALATMTAVHAADANCQPDKLAQKYPSLVGKVLKIGGDPQTPPYVMRDKDDVSKVVGIDADLARAVFDCAGVKYEFVLGGWTGLFPALTSGQIDVMWDDLYYNPERGQKADFVIYMQAASGSLVAAGNPKKVDSIADFCGKTVAYGMASTMEKAVKAQDAVCKTDGKPAIDGMVFQDLSSGLRLIDSGRADAMLWDLGFVDSLAAEHPDKYARSFSKLDGFQIGAAAAKGNADLINAIRDGLTALQADGTEKRIITKYKVDTALELPVAVKN